MPSLRLVGSPGRAPDHTDASGRRDISATISPLPPPKAKPTPPPGRSGRLLRLAGTAAEPDAWAASAQRAADLAARLERFSGHRFALLGSSTERPVRFDHLIVARTAIYVVDVKRYGGPVSRVATSGRPSRPGGTVLVGEYDLTPLLDGIRARGAAIESIIRTGRGSTPMAVIPTLCLVQAQWGKFSSSFVHEGVWIARPQSLVTMARAKGKHSPARVWSIAALLDSALSPR